MKSFYRYFIFVALGRGHPPRWLDTESQKSRFRNYLTSGFLIDILSGEMQTFLERPWWPNLGEAVLH